MILGSICNSFRIYTLLAAHNRAQIEEGELLLVIPDIALWRALTTLAFLLDAAWLAAAAKAAGPLSGGLPVLRDDGLAAVVIERRACPCCRGERPDPAEILIAARRLGGARPHLAAVGGIVHHEDLWQLCSDELIESTPASAAGISGGRWFGVVVGATPRLGELPRGQTIPWRVIAAQIAPPALVGRPGRQDGTGTGLPSGPTATIVK